MGEVLLSSGGPLPASGHASAIERLGDAVAAVCVTLAAIALGVVVGVNGANVIGRYFFNRPIAWAEELMLFLMVFIVFAGVAALTWRQLHIRIDALVSRLPRSAQRAANFLSAVAGVVVLATVAWASFNTVSLLYAFEQRSDALELPMWIPQSFVAGGMALNACLLILRLIGTITRAPR